MEIILTLTLTSCFSTNRKGDVPPFDLLLPDSTTVFNTSQIPRGKPVVLIYFSPDCEHCQQQTQDILNKIDSLNEVNFYFITNDPFDRLKIFNKYYKLYKYKNIMLGRDINFSFIKYFKPTGTPYLIVYNQRKVLRAVFGQETKATRLIQFMNETM